MFQLMRLTAISTLAALVTKPIVPAFGDDAPQPLVYFKAAQTPKLPPDFNPDRLSDPKAVALAADWLECDGTPGVARII